ncbi:hypothetical protein LOTGIDRAFT_233378 [Lottia gigantea]|uniref:Protein DP71L n=1 Tax=Lottia gigantea TaxID=225164 RepID=V4A4E2_LOTGI|nr:hypothetical protein LOTGIDRAFT_233378 [Lottia gigantea]ESO91572.1 hypothetical protein LOTGIDRAFT_233378 [Lottia gigantea]
MWFKNLSNSINNTLNRPSKLLRLDSTGETTKENCDYMPTIQVISSHIPKNVTAKKSCFDFSPQQPPWSLGLVNNMGSCGFMNNFSGKYRGKEREIIRKEAENVKMPIEKMRKAEVETRSCSSWPNHERTSKMHQNGFWTNPRNFNSLKVPADSPWLKVNSGYFQPHKGSYNNYHSHFWGSRNNFCDKNNSSNHRVKTKHKRLPDENPKTVRNTSNHSSVEPKPLVCDVGSKGFSEVKPVIKDISSSISPKPTIVVWQTFFKMSNQLRKKLENFQIQCEPNSQQIRITEMATPASVTIPSAINCQTSSQSSKPQIHLSIIGGKCQSKQQTPPNSVCSQSKINQDCQSNRTTPTDSNQSKQNCDSKSAQEKNCSLCMAYMSRVDPKCTEFPKSAGCNHSIILLRVRDTPKKTKKRKNQKEKTDVNKTSPSSFIVGVNSSDSPENSHIFQFISHDSESDDSWDSFDDDEDETDSAACDWSKLEMDKLFPGSNGLFNPIKFNVHISQSDSETSDSSSPTNNYLDSINLSWNIHIVEDQSKDSTCRKSKTQKKVRFEEGEKLTTVYQMVAWSFAYRASRKGPWEQYARDRERFQRKIRDLEEVLSQILIDSHRSKIFNSLCAKTD